MGSVALGLGEIGSAYQQAKAQKQKEDFERARMGIEQGQLGVSQKYAGIAGQRETREQKEFEERQRLAKLPKFVGFRTVGGKLYYGVQQADGTVQTKEVTGVNSAEDAQAIETAIQALPPDAQPAARATVVPYLATEDYQGARGALKPISQKYAESQLPGQTTTSQTTQNLVLDTPQGPKVVAVPKTTVTRKGPTGTKAPSLPQPRSAAQVAQDLGLPSGSRVLGTKPPTRGEISKLIDPVGDADRRYSVMLDAAKHPNAQNDVAMLFNHIGMTLSAQRGARITNAEILRAIDARSVPEDLLAMWQKVTTGQFLTPDQRQNMLGLGKKNREFIWQQAWEKGKAEAMANRLPRTLPGLPPVSGIHYTGEDVTLKAGGKARVTEVHPDGSYEVKPY